MHRAGAERWKSTLTGVLALLRHPYEHMMLLVLYLNEIFRSPDAMIAAISSLTLSRRS
jgi:hypothetical protein